MYQYNEIDARFVRERVEEFRDQVRRRLSGELTEDQFRPLRLMNGLYLQRHAYMLRIAIPYGLVSSAQMRTFGYISQRWDRGFGHWTTRQNIQFNWVRLEDVPDILLALAQVEMHAIQTSGNCVRNITNDPHAGVAPDEVFDTRPISEILRRYKELHPEFMFLPRKFKFAISGGADDRAATAFHDIGLRAVIRDGRKGMAFSVGGGMGRTPRIAQLVNDFVPLEDTLTYAEAILRVYNLNGRRDNKYKARIKILVGDMGVEAFRAAVDKEWELIKGTNRVDLEEVARVAAAFEDVAYEADAAAHTAHLERARTDQRFAAWLRWNVKEHREPGYNIAYVSCKAPGRPPGDIITEQFYAVADLMDRYNQGRGVVTYNQNMALQNVRNADLEAVYDALTDASLSVPNIDSIADMICCPGHEFCSLANAESIPVAKVITERFKDLDEAYDVGKLHINISGCINACGHHHSGHIGILGIDKRGEDYYQISVGGHPGTNDHLPAAIATILGPAVPPDQVVDSIERLIEVYVSERTGAETFIETVNRIGVDPFKEAYIAA